MVIAFPGLSRGFEVTGLALAVAMSCAAAAADDCDVFKGGLWRTFEYDEPTDEPIIFSGESRCEKAFSSEYCIWLDLWYDDGTPVWQRRADWSQGTHDWERTVGAFVPKRPVKKIEMHAFLRNGTGKAEFRNLKLERREGKDDVLGAVQWMTERPYPNRDRLVVDVFTGRKIERRMSEREIPASLPGIWECPLPKGGTVVWTADSMRRVTPLTFPDTAERTAAPEASVSLAKRESESFQIEISCGEEAEWRDGGVVLPVLRNAHGEALKGALEWRRVGYVRREPGYYPHPCGVPPHETWLPDPLLPPAPFRVRPASTQGLWVTVRADADAAPGVYSGDLALTEGGKPRATVRVTAKVEDFSLPETFGMKTSFSVMDGFTRAQYPDRFEEKKRQSWDIMLDHRLNPDDISRTSPPDIDDLLYARSRGMNLFNILNIVPQPEDPKTKWVCWVPPAATEDPAFYPAFKARLEPYVAELRKLGLEKLAYLYGFDERESEYYPGIDELWHKLKADFPDIPVMTTAMMYRDYAAGKTNLPCLLTTDWHCPLTDVYRPDVSDEMRRHGKKVWWYVCCGPRYPYANFASLEYPPVEGRLLGWMTHLFRADGLLYWHVNYWNGPCVDEGDTFLPDWKTFSPLRMPGDGVLLYPGKEHVLPSIRLAQVRDAVEDYEWLQLAAAKAGADAADAASRSLVRSMTNFTRDPVAVRAARDRLAEIIAGNGENDMNESESKNRPSAWGLVVPALGKNPVAVTIAAQVSNVFVLPLAVAAILWLLNRRGVMGEHRAGPSLNVLLALAFFFSLAVAFAGGKALFERFIREPPSAGNVAQSQPAYVDVPPVAISNGVLSATISPFGAELRSVRMDGIEYLWQQEPDRPSGMAPVLFPICGSLNQGRYTFGVREYALPVHGFAKRSLFRTECALDGASATFTLESDDATRAVYPFDFALAITFRLDGRTLSVEASVTNRCDAEMPFAYGGHPGFRVPLGGEGAFEDWFLEFGPDAAPEAFAFAEGGLLAGSKRAFPLEPGGRLPLRHDLFNTYGIFLSGTGGSVTLRSGKSPRSVTVRFPDMPDVGFWHAPGEAPFLCIEPWTGMPSVAGVPDDLAVRPDMVRLAPGAAATLRYFVEFR